MKDHCVWHVTWLPAGAKTIKHKWVFVKKMNPDGTLNKFKARLVACGYSQIHGQNYFETFSPTVSQDNVMLVVAAHYDWEAHQVDVQTVFQNAPLKEDVYMTTPEGVNTRGGATGNCVKLDKALYGLEQALRTWNRELVRFLKNSGFN